MDSGDERRRGVEHLRQGGRQHGDEHIAAGRQEAGCVRACVLNQVNYNKVLYMKERLKKKTNKC